jgi:hypothetical protein
VRRVSSLVLLGDIRYQIKVKDFSRGGTVARPKVFSEHMIARLVAGTFERMKAVLAPGENRADLVREAVEREISRRERSAWPSPRDKEIRPT